MPDLPPEVIIKKLDVTLAILRDRTSRQPTVNTELENFKAIYEAITETVNENDLTP